MAQLRSGFVLAGLLIIVLVLVVPVHADLFMAGGTLVPDMAAFGSAIPDDSSRAVFAAAVSGDTVIPVPVTADSVSVNPGESLQTAINNAADGDTIYLAPGIYREHDLVILNKNLIIAANESLGGNRDNTIIDAEGNGRIFDMAGVSGTRFYLFNLTLQNGLVSGDGGAVSSDGMDVWIVYSTLTNCSASGSGGAVNVSSNTPVYVVFSTISDCSAGGDGGAIRSEEEILSVYSTISGCSAGGNGGAFSSDSLVYIMYATVSDCTAGGSGGAVYADEGALVVYSTISDCTAPGGSGGAAYSRDIVGILYSAITGCSAGVNGGAACADTIGAEIQTSTITDCSAGGNGGAVYSADQIFMMQDSTISDCSAGGSGGAVYSTVSTPFIPYFGSLIESATITDCTAGGSGGAIYSNSVADTLIISSQFSGCSASADGGAIWTYAGLNTSMNFSRIYGNTPTAVYSPSSPFNAEKNWWGSNDGPAAGSVIGNVDYTPWLVLGIIADPMELTLPQTAYIRTNLTYTLDGANTAGEGISVPDAITNTYAVVSGPGIVAPATAGTTNGGAQSTYVTTIAGTPTIAGTVDGQTVYITLNVAQGTWTPAPTEVPNNDDWPNAGTGASGGSGSGSVSTTGTSDLPLMTVTVNIGGDSKAGHAVVTGTGLSGMIVTGTVKHDAGSNMTSPPWIIFQYISLVPARYTTITNAVINFTVPQSWLDENNIAPESIVLYRQTANGWEALPTTVLYSKDGTMYFSAQSAGFSLFAIAGTRVAATPVSTGTMQGIPDVTVSEQVPAATAVTQKPVTTRTIALPAPAEPVAGSSEIPIVPAFIGMGCVGIIGGSWYARRWYIRRQNPVLFAEDS